jgi:16S rRNA (adenine1518-N6/adenine1519-N6)-dimethyltransferase
MDFLERTKFLLREYRIFPNRLLGQNFMVDFSVLQSMAEYASLRRNDVVLDIGAGLGFLTRFLSDKCKSVLAVESDVQLVKVLREQVKDLSNVKLVEGDVLKASISRFSKVVSIPPYDISSRLLLWLFDKDFECAVLIFQKEFANRLVASVGSEDYGWLTVFTYYHVEVELLDDVPRRVFYPQPEVDSIIVRLKPRKVLPFKLKNEVLFKQLVRSLFTQRNRKVRNAILSFVKSMPAMATEEAVKLVEAFPFCDKRVRELAPEDFGVLANAFVD